MTFAEAHAQARVVNDDAMRLGCEPPLFVVTCGDSHTLEIAGDRFVRYERARFRRAATRDARTSDDER